VVVGGGLECVVVGAGADCVVVAADCVVVGDELVDVVFEEWCGLALWCGFVVFFAVVVVVGVVGVVAAFCVVVVDDDAPHPAATSASDAAIAQRIGSRFILILAYQDAQLAIPFPNRLEAILGDPHL
jgi:hypothetical protein